MRSVNAENARESNPSGAGIGQDAESPEAILQTPVHRRANPRREGRRAMTGTELQLGPRIRSLRQARHVTLRELAEQAGVTESFLSQVEREVTSPSIASVQRIARALDLGIAELFADDQPHGRVVRDGDR